MRQRCQGLPIIHRLLSILRPQLLQNSTPINPIDPEEHTIPLVGTALQSIRNTQNTYVPKTHPSTTRLHKTILPRHRCLILRRGSRTLTGGRNQPSNKENHAIPNSVLLSHIHSNRTKLRHLRKRTPGPHKSTTSLETSHSSNRNTSHSTHRPRQPYILEDAKEGELKSGPMVRRTARIQPNNQTHTRQTPHHGRHAFETPN